MKTFDSVLINIENHIATVTLNRPGAGNSFDGEFFKEVAEAIYLCEGDENVQVILLTGSGRNFSVGGDIQGRCLHLCANVKSPWWQSSMVLRLGLAVP